MAKALTVRRWPNGLGYNIPLGHGRELEVWAARLPLDKLGVQLCATAKASGTLCGMGLRWCEVPPDMTPDQIVDHYRATGRTWQKCG